MPVMQTKRRDVPMCGIHENLLRAKPVLHTDNFLTFVDYIQERYLIHLKKDVMDKPKPWTDDEILLNYKFTNVRREHDTQSKELIRRVSTNPALEGRLETKIVNTFMFRAWNNADTFEFFGLPKPIKTLYSPRAKETARAKLCHYRKHYPAAYKKRKWWSNAYNQGGTKYAWKFPDGEGFGRAPSEEEAARHPDFEPDIPLRVFHIPVWMDQCNTAKRIMNADTQQEVFDIIRELRGFKDFMAYQIFVDLTYIPEFPFSENEFTVAGPGCKRGIDKVFMSRDGLSYEACIFWLRNNWNKLMKEYNVTWNADTLFCDVPKYDRCVNVMMLENCFCEISKYIRFRDGGARPKLRYPGGGE